MTAKAGESQPQLSPAATAADVTKVEWLLGMPPSPVKRETSKRLLTIINVKGLRIWEQAQPMRAVTRILFCKIIAKSFITYLL